MRLHFVVFALFVVIPVMVFVVIKAISARRLPMLAQRRTIPRSRRLYLFPPTLQAAGCMERVEGQKLAKSW